MLKELNLVTGWGDILPYIKQTVRAGNTIFTYKYFSLRYGLRNIARGPNEGRYTEYQKKINENLRNKKLIWYLCENFSKGDWWITLNYRRGERPEDIIRAESNLKKVLAKLRRQLKKQGIAFSYMAMTEQGKKGGLHHHIVIRNNFDVGMIIKNKMWPHGKVIIDDIYTESLCDLADYFVKGDSKESEKRYTRSRNLRPPKIKKTVVPAKGWAKAPKPKKGYDIAHQYNGFHDFSGYPYQEYTQVRRC